MTKTLKEQLLEKGLLKLAGTLPILHKAYRIKKCRYEGRTCAGCTDWQYNQCVQKYGAGKD
jgi:hypothetical protein